MIRREVNLLEGIANVKGDSGVIIDAKCDEWDAIPEEWASVLGLGDKAVGSWRAPRIDVI